MEIENSRCIGTTVKGKQCQKKKMEDSKYCRYHIHQASPELVRVPGRIVEKKEIIPEKQTSISNDCPICLMEVEKNEDAKPSCGHQIHIDCAKQLRNPICPMCRKELSGGIFNTNLLKKMEEKKRNDNEEREQQEFEEYLEGQERMTLQFIRAALERIEGTINNVQNQQENIRQEIGLDLQQIQTILGGNVEGNILPINREQLAENLMNFFLGPEDEEEIIDEEQGRDFAEDDIDDEIFVEDVITENEANAIVHGIINDHFSEIDIHNEEYHHHLHQIYPNLTCNQLRNVLMRAGEIILDM